MPIFKAAENKKGGGKGGFKTSPKPTLDYITRSDKAAIVTSFYLDDDVDYAMQFADTKKVWNKAQSKSSRKYYHFIHSFSAYDDITPELAHELTVELCRKTFPDSEIVIATHTDTDHVHCHIVINSVNFTNGKMLQISPKAYTAIKDLSNELALEKGLTPVDFRKPSREPVRQSQVERQIILRGGTSWKQELCEVIDYAKQNSVDMEEFQNILAQYGIEITRNTEKTIAYKHPKKAKAIRGEKLGQNYTKEAILNVIEEHNYRSTSFGYEEPDGSADFDWSAGIEDIQSYFSEHSAVGGEYQSEKETVGERESDEYYRELEREAERRRNSAWER